MVGTPSYSYNTSRQRDGTIATLGADVTIRISIFDDESLYNTIAVIPLQPYDYLLEWPLTCSDNVDKRGTFAFHTCYTTRRSEIGLKGTTGMAQP
jgi:hypothetical protein